MLFFCTCTLYLRNQAHVQRTYKQIFLQNQVRTPAYTHKKSYVTSADMNKSVTLAQTHTHTHTPFCLCGYMHTHIHPPTHNRQTQTVTHTHTHNHGQAVSHTRRAGTIMSALFCLLFHWGVTFWGTRWGGAEGRRFSDEKHESGWRERKANKKSDGAECQRGRECREKICAKYSKQTISPELPGDQERQRKWRGRKCVLLENIVSIN